VNKTSKPNFICIGYPKSGTSWLAHQLRNHPETYVHPFKELRFFLEGTYIPPYSAFNLLFSRNWHYRLLRRQLMLRLKKPQFYKEHKKYFLSKHTLSWYQSLFPTDQIAGEVTPLYYWLTDLEVSKIAEQFPDLKIILLLRDPVERVWSNYKMDVRDKRGAKISTGIDIKHPAIQQLLKIDQPYTAVISRWKQFFSNVHVCYYDQLTKHPELFLEDILTFLSCQSKSFNPLNLDIKVNKTTNKNIPPQLKTALIEKYRPEVEALAKEFPSQYSNGWLHSYTQFAENKHDQVYE
jgi:hypothetical protein